MRSKKLLILYAFLLIVAVVTMVQLRRLNQRPQEIGPRDYPEIKEEGILRMITEYNQSGYFVSGDTVQGFQYELSQAIAKLSGLEVQTHLEMSLAKSFEELSDNKCDVIARNIPITSEMRENYLFTEPIVLNKQVLVQRTAEANNGQAPIRNQLDLAQKTLYIPKDSPALLRLQNLGHEIGDTIYVVEDELYSTEQLMIMVAKGNRSIDVTNACKKHGGFYLGSIGGPAAILAKNSIKSVEVVDFEELGMEAVRKIRVENFPAFIIVDDKGNDFFADFKH